LNKDEFYTPPSLARDMVEAASESLDVTSVADFAAGGGALLEAAQVKWAPSRVIATDVSTRSVSLLRKMHPDWVVGRCDFLSNRSRSASHALRASDATSLVLLNPPFSSRGGARVVVNSAVGAMSASRALGFVLSALPYLAVHGEIVALLPAGTLDLQKDAAAWLWLRSKFSLVIVERYGRTAFSGAHARTVLVRLSGRHATSDGQRAHPLHTYRSQVRARLTRGNRQMHTVHQPMRGRSGKIGSLIHSTDVRDGGILEDLRQIQMRLTDREVRGPAVLLPRVGKPDRDKVVILEMDRVAILSDCMYAICCRTLSDASSVRYRMRRDWPRLEELYGGSCAPFLSMMALRGFLDSIAVVMSGETT
jgi:hypothetical protein